MELETYYHPSVLTFWWQRWDAKIFTVGYEYLDGGIEYLEGGF